jgi:Tfp pilus assembly protein PilN
VFLVILLLSNLFYGYQGLKQLSVLDNRLNELDLQVADIRGAPADYSAEKYQAIKSEVAVANQIVAADQVRWTGLLSRFEEVVPGDVSLQSIQPNYKERSLNLRGVARDVTAMTGFMDNLLTSDDFRQVFLQQHAEIDVELEGRTQKQTGFSLVIREAF